MPRLTLCILTLILTAHTLKAEMTPSQRIAMGMESTADVQIYLRSPQIATYLQHELPL